MQFMRSTSAPRLGIQGLEMMMDRDQMISSMAGELGKMAEHDEVELLFHHLLATGEISVCNGGYAVNYGVDLLGRHLDLIAEREGPSPRARLAAAQDAKK